jgi:hypothetical protein
MAMCGVTRAPFNSNRRSCGIEVVAPFFFYQKPTHGYAATREAAVAAFTKSWRREKHRDPPRKGAARGIIAPAETAATEAWRGILARR